MISATGLVGVAAGVPYVAHRPPGDRRQAPLVVVLHLMDPPRSEAAMAAALPLAGLPAWRAYLGLPMFGARMPPGGQEEFMRLGCEDALLKVLGPVVEQAAQESFRGPSRRCASSSPGHSARSRSWAALRGRQRSSSPWPRARSRCGPPCSSTLRCGPRT